MTLALNGYTEQRLESGIPLLTAGALQVSGKLPVTLDGVPQMYG